ncbi:hypothetical protein N7509_004102 [Penicillium cosmopolitanum]|uniref:aldehyde dehydrogenase (NAD(+)) n=1 Tax=Penicillium cosmopolitanum TaxID=1131564 RepID=A0A9X0BBZ9_9EURO|nr:uncharacterized protein N7509_004102 [Penicillium cosmopolitanum]KAJ5404231.1 hypothetical protein N7509_004102 [Penicillium cosmopolitanum]
MTGNKYPSLYAVVHQRKVDDSLFCDQVQYAAAEDVDAAVEAAEAAFKGPWRKFTATQRGEALVKLSALILEHKEELGYLDGTSIGKSQAAATGEAEFAASILSYYAGWADKYPGESYPGEDGFVKIVRQEPLGVCVGINPWNGPLAIMAMKLGPALAMGNVIILKPSEKTPLASNRLAFLASESGILPPGVFQSLSGAGATGAMLANHMRVRKVSFTGSISTGKKIQEAAAKSNLKRVTLELGGKSPSGIFEDCNFDNAVWWSVFAITQNTGQACFAASRVYVQESIADKFVEAFTKGMSQKQNELAPLADKIQLSRVSSFFQRDAGKTKILVGGKQHGDKGCYWEPTVFYNPEKDAQVYNEEIFGPVACISTFKDEEEFLRLANDTEYGLMAGVFTQDINRAMRISSELDSGVVGINCVSTISLQTPFGGSKQSGIGREMSHYALRSYSEPKTVLINMNY